MISALKDYFRTYTRPASIISDRNRACGIDSVHASSPLQNMARGRHAQRLESQCPLSYTNKGWPDDLRNYHHLIQGPIKRKTEPSSKESLLLVSQEDAGSYTFKVVKDYIYNISMEKKRRITSAKRCYYGLSKEMCKSSSLFRPTKLTLYKTLIQRKGVYWKEKVLLVLWIKTDMTRYFSE